MTDKVTEMRVRRTMEALRGNNIAAYFAESRSEVVPLIQTLISKGDTVSNGGSETLKQCGVIDLLKNGDYNYLDRSRAGITPEEVRQVYLDTYGADAYFCSANAVTENGELYNVDGNSNRVSAILFGPKSVVMVVGVNKIVRDLNDAVRRVKMFAAPANTMRLGCETYCAKAGQCASLAAGCDDMTAGCTSDGRICCNFVVSAKQRVKDRIKVIFVNEPLGY